MAESYPKDTIDAKLEAIEARMDARVDKTLSRFDAFMVEVQADRRVSDERFKSLESSISTLNQRITDTTTHLSNQMTWGFSILGIIIAIAAIVVAVAAG